MKAIENLRTSRLLLIIIGVLCVYSLNSDLRTLTAQPGTSCVGSSDFFVSARDEGQRHSAIVESLLIATESSEEAERSDLISKTLFEREEPVVENTSGGSQTPQKQRQRSFNFKPILTGEPRSWEIMGNITRPLNFLHIPKAGGTSIFSAAAKNGLSWGECLFPSGGRFLVCPDTTDVGEWPNHPYQAQWWHTPIQYLPKNKNPYYNHDIFAVVRNPYERAVSEYYYYCRFQQGDCFGKDNEDTPDRLNRKLQQFLLTALRARLNSTDYYQSWGHWIPQYDFFYNTTSRKKERLVPHLLHHEYLNDEFDSLMRAYGLNFTLPETRRKSRHDRAKLTTSDLTDKTMKLIDIVFEKDFILGNYEMLTGKLTEATATE